MSPAAPAAEDVRRLGSDDLLMMRALNVLLSEAFDDATSYADKPPSDAYLTAWLAKPHHIALVALDGEALVGGLVAYQLEKFEQARSEIYIYDLAVAGLHRRRGVATALIEYAQAIAAELGAWVVFVQADHDDPPAVALYTKLGMREDVLHFDLPVERDR